MSTFYTNVLISKKQNVNRKEANISKAFSLCFFVEKKFPSCQLGVMTAFGMADARGGDGSMQIYQAERAGTAAQPL